MHIIIADSWEGPDNYCSDKCSPVFIKNFIVSVTCDQKTVNIWEPNSILDSRISLVAHKRKINALAVSPKNQNFICTCSDDKIVLWKVNCISSSGNCTDGNASPVGVTFAFDSGYVDYCTFSWNDEWLALCRENEILIIKIKWSEDSDKNFDVSHHGTVETNSGSGNLCAFSPWNCEIIVTTEDSSYFKVWNILTMNLLYKSPKIGMYSITHCSFANSPPYLLLGTNGGIVSIFSFNENNIPKCLMNVNVNKAFSISEECLGCGEADHYLKQKRSNESVELKSECGEIGCFVFGVYLFKREMQLFNKEARDDTSENISISSFLSCSDQTLKSILYPNALIAVCCNLGIALYNCNSWECESVLKTLDMFPPSTLPSKSLPLISFLVIGGDSLDNFFCLVKMSPSHSKILILKLQALEENFKDMKLTKGTVDRNQGKSVIPLETVRKSSPLRYQMSSHLSAQASPYTSKELKKKSSGYGKTSRTQMFLPVINKKNQNKNSTGGSQKQLKSSKSFIEHISDQSISESGPPTKAGLKFCVWETTGTAVQLATAGGGENMACSSTASYICVLKSSDLNPEKGLNLIGHNGPVNSLHYSLNSKWLEVNKNSIAQARFYYMDQFVLTISQDYLELFSHLLHEIDSHQVQDFRTKRISKINVPAQHITCFSAANQFHSYIILCCCSNRSLQVYDMNVQKFVSVLENIHSRPAHHLKQMEGSQFLAHPPGMYNLFLTAAVCDSTKLWDLRSGRCVQKYCQHVNRAYSSGIDISPCGCYVAAGSEDKYASLIKFTCMIQENAVTIYTNWEDWVI
ncbi:Protein of unknown function [Gryllus bimaculatus]|nr:Protein of unknown function [Gryllus bimaculatus]